MRIVRRHISSLALFASVANDDISSFGTKRVKADLLKLGAPNRKNVWCINFIDDEMDDEDDNRGCTPSPNLCTTPSGGYLNPLRII
ncbi:hypothetical protein AVEN_11780-1 [Araneus ventricosus]|uniref:Uncharacterized protein n=1 Tax=Araneus ventricosus TaxID=182803 RepID=A0A4Y2QLW8_ARAVE|nr:hypothetical protein AVEN_11780-1 [Araneus ventricosus]